MAFPSPKLHWYWPTVPSLSEEPEASNMVAWPTLVELAVNAAVGAWSGTIAIPVAEPPSVIGVPAVLVVISIGVTLPVSSFATRRSCRPE
jgi:hypothetical protein